MDFVPQTLLRSFVDAAARGGATFEERGAYQKWLRLYLDFCARYQRPPGDRSSRYAFDAEIRSKGAWEDVRAQAGAAVELYLRVTGVAAAPALPRPRARAPISDIYGPAPGAQRQQPAQAPRGASDGPAAQPPQSPALPPPAGPSRGPAASPSMECAQGPCPTVDPPLAPTGERESPPVLEDHPAQAPEPDAVLPPPEDAPGKSSPTRETGTDWTWVYQSLTDAIEERGYSARTLEAYRTWTENFQSHVQSVDAHTVVTEDVKDFLGSLAATKTRSPSTYNQAHDAVMFLFRHILEKTLDRASGVVRAKRKRRLPVVLTRDEVNQVLQRLEPPYRLVAGLLYGCGLRLLECLNLRLQDVNVEVGVLIVRDGNGQRDRTVPLPQALTGDLRHQMEVVRHIHAANAEAADAGTDVPDSPGDPQRLAREPSGMWLFPASGTRQSRRGHLHETQMQKAISNAVKVSRIRKRASAQTLRNSFASHLLQGHYDLRAVQELLGHRDVRSTRIYARTFPSAAPMLARSPLDL